MNEIGFEDGKGAVSGGKPAGAPAVRGMQQGMPPAETHQGFAPQGTPAQKAPEEPAEDEFTRNVEQILVRLGMAGEKGSADIVHVCTYLNKKGMSMRRENVRNICGKLSDAPKSMEQRMRRAVQTGLTNLAHLGIEDFMNDTFTEYSSTLFLFEEVRAEMDYVRGKRSYGGKVSLKKFIESLMLQAERPINV
ncbi:MAG: DNA-binding domain-containing protein [Stomatobaculum sp.]|nr:DNA-binding domain-containing protein [Stomatobaculum sp.]